MTKPIIAAVDPRREDLAPATLGAWFARTLGAPLMLAAAHPVDVPLATLYPEYARDIARATRRAVEAVAERIERPGLEPTTVALPAGESPARALHELAVREGAQLLVIGSSDRGPAGRVAPSAVTDRLLHGAPCPVAVAPAGFGASELPLIGVAFTDTPDGHAALAFADVLAAAATARLRVLTVAPPASPLVAGTMDALAVDTVQRAGEESARRALELGTGAASVTTEGALLAGNPAQALAGASEDLDLLVCGSRGYGPLRTVLLGGTSHALVRRAACPVVVVPPGAVAKGRARASADPAVRA